MLVEQQGKRGPALLFQKQRLLWLVAVNRPDRESHSCRSRCSVLTINDLGGSTLHDFMSGI